MFLPYISFASSLLVDTHPTAHHNYFKWSKISSMSYVFLQDQAPYCTRSTLWLIRIADMFTQMNIYINSWNIKILESIELLDY